MKATYIRTHTLTRKKKNNIQMLSLRSTSRNKKQACWNFYFVNKYACLNSLKQIHSHTGLCIYTITWTCSHRHHRVVRVNTVFVVSVFIFSAFQNEFSLVSRCRSCTGCSYWCVLILCISRHSFVMEHMLFNWVKHIFCFF